ncbi:MAG: hypothetical protein AUH29_14535 [Candidatus Rokubacteria bacterium 13_1_40CM_69_27]|nr:MAG: hypothetical protein AUH29_14535 [Candidatus Rokubacteria bacterium 13_1_40CM_69_27]OLC32225.1 MAG: hypothetical protein AUH81_16675 [Candidatus Rokubacteria bacterium 13_1_40CM_4_69_5]
MVDDRKDSPPTQRAGGATPKIRWDDSSLKSSYANVCNVSSTREEVVLVFGINQAWERGQNELHVQLTDRIILSPFAAKRLAGLLANVVREYESRFGALNVEARRPGDPLDQ